MSSEKQIHSLKTALIVVSILLLCAIVDIFKFADDTKTLVSTVNKVQTEKEFVTNKLQKLETYSETVGSKKPGLSKELVTENDAKVRY